MATHPYQGEDEDELTFEKGAVIAVIPYDDPEDEVGMTVKSRVLANVWICLTLSQPFLKFDKHFRYRVV